MNSWGTILLGYGIVFGAVGLYAYSLVRRGAVLGSKMGLGKGQPLAGNDAPNSWEAEDAGT